MSRTILSLIARCTPLRARAASRLHSSSYALAPLTSCCRYLSRCRSVSRVGKRCCRCAAMTSLPLQLGDVIILAWRPSTRRKTAKTCYQYQRGYSTVAQAFAAFGVHVCVAERGIARHFVALNLPARALVTPSIAADVRLATQRMP